MDPNALTREEIELAILVIEKLWPVSPGERATLSESTISVPSSLSDALFLS